MWRYVSPTRRARWFWFKCPSCARAGWNANYKVIFAKAPIHISTVYQCANCHLLSINSHGKLNVALTFVLAAITFLFLYNIMISGLPPATAILLGVGLILLSVATNVGMCRLVNVFEPYHSQL